MKATLSVGALVYSLMYIDGEAQYYVVGNISHDIPMENMEACRQAMREDGNRMVETIEEELRAYWEPVMEEGEELVLRSGASCSRD